jgi:dihydroneopterin aldolase
VALKRRNDRITLAAIKIHPRIGVTPEERAVPQECEADLTVWNDLEGAASQDSLPNSIDYSRLLASVQETASDGEYSLVETLAYKIARNVLQRFPVDRTSIRIRKRPASLAGQIDFVEVEIEIP